MKKLSKSAYKLWSIWFVCSVVIILLVLFVGTWDNSKLDYPNWPIAMGAALFNMVINVLVGLNSYVGDDE